MPVPLNVITGAPGSGKSHFLSRLVARRPKNARWVIIECESSPTRLDAARAEDERDRRGAKDGERATDLEGDRDPDQDQDDGFVLVRRLSGCACCGASAALKVMLVQLLRRAKPTRVFVETSGAASPGVVIDTLTSAHVRASVDVQTTFAVVDVREFGKLKARARESEIWEARLACADAVVGSFADACDDGDINAFDAFVRDIWPKKNAIVAMTNDGAIDLSILEHECLWEASALAKEAANSAREGTASLTVRLPKLERDGAPWMGKSSVGGFSSCGYAFHADDVFVRPLLKEFFDAFVLGRADVERFRGTLRLGCDWVRPDVARGDDGKSDMDSSMTRSIAFTTVAYRRDSRFELIRKRGVDAATDDDEDAFWNLLRDKLMACRKPPRAMDGGGLCRP